MHIEKSKSYVQLLRSKQWIKNLFVLAPLIFSGRFTEWNAIKDSLITFVLFSLVSSIVYIINDIKDVEFDRLHPIKRRVRPLASGKVRKQEALLLTALLALFALKLTLLINPKVTITVLTYVIVNIIYSFGAKKLPVVDIFLIASGFLLRIYAGALSISVPISSWMLITTFSLALFLASVKRLQELRLIGTETRETLNSYTEKTLENYALISATSSLIFYSLFVITTKPYLAFSVLFVVFGILRYWFLVESKELGESPTEVILKDRVILLDIILWVLYCSYEIWRSGAVR